MRFTIALLQILPFGIDQAGDLEKGIDYCRRAKELGADLALFPEMWNIGYARCPFDDEGRRAWEESAIDNLSEFFQEYVTLAKTLEFNIALTYLERHFPKPRNTVSIIGKTGDIALNYSKVFICDFGKDELLKEKPDSREIGSDHNCSPGTTFDVCTLQGKEGDVKVGAMICADREFPEPATQLMLNGAELVVVPNSCNWDGVRRALLKARAFENLVGIAVANYPSPQANGHSSAYHCAAWDRKGNPEDTLIVEAGEEEGITLAEFDLDQIREFREMESWRLEYRREWARRQ